MGDCGFHMNNAMSYGISKRGKKHTISRRQLIMSCLILLYIGTCLILPSYIAIILALIIVLLFSISGYRAYKCRERIAVAWLLVLPLFFSAFQNIWLGIGVQHQNELSLQVLLSTNFLVEIFLILVIILSGNAIPKRNSFCLKIVAILTVQAVLLYFIYPTGISAFISSYRNIISCIIVFWVSLTYSSRADKNVIDKIITIIAWVVVVFGLFEFFYGTRVWTALNIKPLWDLKGIGTNLWGVPRNWYSSERIAGQQIRRMVSTFADPVNLGTYLFAAFIHAWYKREKVLQIALIICCALTISKGALLGFLIFAVVLTWYKDKSKILPIAAVVFGLAIGMYFVAFSRSSSTGSLFAHVNGFLSSIKLMITHPWGYGVGRIGVLSRLFSTDFLDTSVTETGIGMIMAQLGVIGLVAYIVFFTKVLRMPKTWEKSDINERIAYYSLAISFIVNAMFNEVALSPNSCILYFLFMGIITMSEKSKRVGMSMECHINSLNVYSIK